MTDKPTYEELEKENKILRQKIDSEIKNSMFHSYFENNKAVMLEVNTETKQITNANDSAIKFYGFPREVLLSKKISDLNILPPEEINLKMKEAIKHESNFFEFSHITADGSIKNVEVYGSPFTYKGKTYMYVTVLDITERKEAEKKIQIQIEEYAALNEEYMAANEELTEKNKEYAALNEEYLVQNEELKKAKETAEKNETRFRQMTELLPQVVYECDINGKLTYVNKQAYNYFGYTEEDFEKGVYFEEALIPEEIEKARQNIQKLFSDEKIDEFEYTVLRKDGTTFPVLIYSSPVFTDNKPGGFRGIIIDITDRKEAETEIKSQNKKLNLIAKIEKTGIFDWDLKTNLTTWNDEMFFIHGIPKKVPMPYENWEKTIHPDDKEKTVKILEESIQTKSPRYAEFRIVRPDGEIRYVRASATVITDNKGNVTNSVGITKDITESKQAEQELLKAKEKAEENEMKFKSIFDFSPQPISISNLSGELIEVNNKLCEISGFTKDELINQNVVDIGFYSKEARQHFLAQLKEKGHTENLELIFYNKAKKEINTLTNATIIKLNGVPHLLSMVTDITKRKKAEAEIIKAKERAEESDRLKTEFINNMSHEIRTPMNGILGFSELLSNPDLTHEKQRNYISIIQNSGKQLMRIIDDILEISKLGTKQVKAINEEICLNDLLLELFSIFDIKAKENKTPLYLKKGLSDEESTIYTDRSKLNKILSNLLENALKFTNTGSIEFGYELKQNKIEIFVKDTGIGIKPEKQAYIFERFSQEEKKVSEHAGGLGLGLSIAKENAELLGGTITLESEKGKGSTFFITIPYNPARKKEELKIKKRNMKTKKQNTILIVEDEEVNFIYIETLLEYFETNMIVLHASDGKQAVDLCKERSDIDFILMDLKMPVMNGYEATKKIKKIRPNTPIIAQTAYSTPEEKQKALSAGCDDFISKPISKEIFSKIIDKYKVT